MTIYSNQLPTTETFTEFLNNYNQDLATNALTALLYYEGTLNVDYDDYLVFFVDYDEEGEAIFAITKILDKWLPVEVNDRIRKFSAKGIWKYDSIICIRII